MAAEDFGSEPQSSTQGVAVGDGVGVVVADGDDVVAVGEGDVVCVAVGVLDVVAVGVLVGDDVGVGAGVVTQALNDTTTATHATKRTIRFIADHSFSLVVL